MFGSFRHSTLCQQIIYLANLYLNSDHVYLPADFRRKNVNRPEYVKQLLDNQDMCCTKIDFGHIVNTMDDRNQRIRLACRALLLFVLIAVQSVVSAHQVDHLNTDENSQCAVCSISSGFDVPAVVSHIAPEVETNSFVSARIHNCTIVEANYSPSTARAPPIYL